MDKDYIIPSAESEEAPKGEYCAMLYPSLEEDIVFILQNQEKFIKELVHEVLAEFSIIKEEIQLLSTSDRTLI